MAMAKVNEVVGTYKGQNAVAHCFLETADMSGKDSSKIIVELLVKLGLMVESWVSQTVETLSVTFKKYRKTPLPLDLVECREILYSVLAETIDVLHAGKRCRNKSVGDQIKKQYQSMKLTLRKVSIQLGHA